MNKKQRKSSKQNFSKTGRKTKRKVNRLKVSIVLFVFILLIGAVIMGVFYLRSPIKIAGNSPLSMFGVQKITIAGDENSKYSPGQLVESSGIFVGQSVFSVNKNVAVENLILQYPYIESVKISSPSFNEVLIDVSITKAEYFVKNASGTIFVLSEKGKLLEISSEGNDLSSFQELRINFESETLGEFVIEDRVMTILNIIKNSTFEEAKQLDFIDVTQLTKINLMWNNQLAVKIGNDVDFDKKIDRAFKVIQEVLADEGQAVTGTLTVDFVEADGNYRVVFTKSE